MKTVLVIITWPLLYVVQFVIVCVATVIVGKALEFSPASPFLVILQLGFGCIAIPLAYFAFLIGTLSLSGKWIWIPGVLVLIGELAQHTGNIADFLREQFSVDNAVGGAVCILTFACMLYSVTLVWLEHRQVRRSDVSTHV